MESHFNRVKRDLSIRWNGALSGKSWEDGRPNATVEFDSEESYTLFLLRWS